MAIQKFSTQSSGRGTTHTTLHFSWDELSKLHWTTPNTICCLPNCVFGFKLASTSACGTKCYRSAAFPCRSYVLHDGCCFCRTQNDPRADFHVTNVTFFIEVLLFFFFAPQQFNSVSFGLTNRRLVYVFLAKLKCLKLKRSPLLSTRPFTTVRANVPSNNSRGQIIIVIKTESFAPAVKI